MSRVLCHLWSHLCLSSGAHLCFVCHACPVQAAKRRLALAAARPVLMPSAEEAAPQPSLPEPEQPEPEAAPGQPVLPLQAAALVRCRLEKKAPPSGYFAESEVLAGTLEFQKARFDAIFQEEGQGKKVVRWKAIRIKVRIILVEKQSKAGDNFFPPRREKIQIYGLDSWPEKWVRFRVRS